MVDLIKIDYLKESFLHEGKTYKQSYEMFPRTLLRGNCVEDFKEGRAINGYKEHEGYQIHNMIWDSLPLECKIYHCNGEHVAVIGKPWTPSTFCAEALSLGE